MFHIRHEHRVGHKCTIRSAGCKTRPSVKPTGLTMAPMPAMEPEIEEMTGSERIILLEVILESGWRRWVAMYVSGEWWWMDFVRFAAWIYNRPDLNTSGCQADQAGRRVCLGFGIWALGGGAMQLRAVAR